MSSICIFHTMMKIKSKFVLNLERESRSMLPFKMLKHLSVDAGHEETKCSCLVSNCLEWKQFSVRSIFRWPEGFPPCGLLLIKPPDFAIIAFSYVPGFPVMLSV